LPETKDGVAYLSASQLSMLMEGVDWRRVKRTSQPQLAG
jgi:transposase